MGDGRENYPKTVSLQNGARASKKTSLSPGCAYLSTIHPYFQKLPHHEQRGPEDARQARRVGTYYSRWFLRERRDGEAEAETKFPRTVKDACGGAPRVRSTGSKGWDQEASSIPLGSPCHHCCPWPWRASSFTLGSETSTETAAGPWHTLSSRETWYIRAHQWLVVLGTAEAKTLRHPHICSDSSFTAPRTKPRLGQTLQEWGQGGRDQEEKDGQDSKASRWSLSCSSGFQPTWDHILYSALETGVCSFSTNFPLAEAHVLFLRATA